MFTTITLNSLSGKLLILVSLGFFSEVLNVLSYGTNSSVSSFCLTFCICFYELEETATSHYLEVMACVGASPVETACVGWL